MSNWMAITIFLFIFGVIYLLQEIKQTLEDVKDVLYEIKGEIEPDPDLMDGP